MKIIWTAENSMRKVSVGEKSPIATLTITTASDKNVASLRNRYE